LIKVGRRLRGKFLRSLVGSSLEVVTEEETQEGFRGLAENYAEVVVGEAGLNELCQVEIAGLRGGRLFGLKRK
jgi:tRNA A37 methylthiotransferase MiaB